MFERKMPQLDKFTLSEKIMNLFIEEFGPRATAFMILFVVITFMSLLLFILFSIMRKGMENSLQMGKQALAHNCALGVPVEVVTSWLYAKVSSSGDSAFPKKAKDRGAAEPAGFTPGEQHPEQGPQ